ncbi:hypothetical protein [Mucilaginibacter sp. HD30]
MSIQTTIRQFSIDVFYFLTSVFRHNNSFAELGLTDHLVHRLSEYLASSGSNVIEIYKSTWKTETKYGNDLDLYIQNASGTYSWYALQAKVMSANGAFKDIKIKGKILEQWDKLFIHEKKFGGKSYYLLYCGKSKAFPTALPHRSDCFGVPQVEELGLGIVETSIIKNIRTVTLTSGSLLYFKHVFPDHIDSVRKLLCDLTNAAPSTKQFTRGEIDTNGYQRIYSADNIESVNQDDLKPKAGLAPIRIIITNEENHNS